MVIYYFLSLLPLKGVLVKGEFFFRIITLQTPFTFDFLNGRSLKFEQNKFRSHPTRFSLNVLDNRGSRSVEILCDAVGEKVGYI